MQIYAAYGKRWYTPLLRKKTIGVISSIFILLVIISLGASQSPPPISPLASAMQPATQAPRSITISNKPKNPQELKLLIQDALDDSIPEYSIVVDDFLSSFTVSVGETSLFTGASVHKIPILTAVYLEAQNNNLDLDKEIVFQEADRQDYGTGVMRYKASGTRYTVRELGSLMIKQSDNTAATILANRVLTMRNIQTTINSLGLTETNMNDNMTSNKDMSLLFNKLFTGKILNGVLTREFIDLLHDSDFEDRIPALLPNTARVYHKIGTAIGGLHDVGVVITPTSMYYIGIFTRGVSDEERATRAIARASRAVYDYMNRK